MKREITFDSIRFELEIFCLENNRIIPTAKDLKKEGYFPSTTVINKIFKNEGYRSYIDYLEKYGFIRQKKDLGNNKNLTYEELCSIFEEYFKEHGCYPNTNTSNKIKGFPTIKRIKLICGDKYEEFKNKYENKKVTYEEYCSRFIEISEKLGRPLTSKELHDKNEYSGYVPDYKWFIKFCPDKNVKNYNDFLLYLGFKQKPYNESKEFVINEIKDLHSKLGRNLKTSDFENIGKYTGNVSMSLIKKLWGNFNNMLIELNLPINQLQTKNKSIDELKNDIIKMCIYIKNNENRIQICQDEVEKFDWCSSKETYKNRFKKELGMSFGEFIKSIGFIPVDIGIGFNHVFDNGEVAKSKHEFYVSSFFRKNNIKYTRNVRYDSFITNYQGNKDCDYVVNHNGEIWYIEVAGMLDYTKNVKKSFIMVEYEKCLNEKEAMLKEQDLNYRIVYPHEIKEFGLGNIFSFIVNKI